MDWQNLHYSTTLNSLGCKFSFIGTKLPFIAADLPEVEKAYKDALSKYQAAGYPAAGRRAVRKTWLAFKLARGGEVPLIPKNKQKIIQRFQRHGNVYPMRTPKAKKTGQN